jgi:hypothetical protein
MNTTCFDKYWSSLDVSKIADETTVFPTVSSIFGVWLRLCTHVSVTCISILRVTLFLTVYCKIQETNGVMFLFCTIHINIIFVKGVTKYF